MSNKKEKDFIVGDVHGTNESLAVIVDKIGYKAPRINSISIGSSVENLPGGKIQLSNIIETIRNNVDQNQLNNDAHHDAQHEKMYPKKLK